MKIISCVGFHATGSGAVDDFLREFDNIQTAEYGIESRFLQDPDGISDLEYNLFDNYHRLNSTFALKRYLYFVEREKRTYHHVFGKQWEQLSKEYIQSLCQFSYAGYFHSDIREFRGLKLLIYKARRMFNKLLPAPIRKNKYYNYFKKEKTYFSNCTREYFLDRTHDYILKLCDLLNPKRKEYVVLDQVISPNHIDRYMPYLPDGSKIIIVTRDPRDVYLNDVIKNNDVVLPHEINQFCEVFRKQRFVAEYSSPNVLFIHFEDMIYRYEETTDLIMRFLGLSREDHILPCRFFNPQISVKNTRLWEKMPGHENEVSIIESKLGDFLYEYQD